jgi:hypothetical protein
MAAHVRTVEIPEANRRELQRRARKKGAPARVVERARIVLLFGDGMSGKQIAARVSCVAQQLTAQEMLPRKGERSQVQFLPRPHQLLKQYLAREALRPRVLPGLVDADRRSEGPDQALAAAEREPIRSSACIR